MPRLSLLSLASLLLAASACTTDDDCEMLGVCTAGAICACLPGWTGPSCGSLALSPAPAAAAYQWPLRAAPNASSWGFSRVFDPADGLFHALAAVACGRIGVIGDGGGDSFIVHLVSPTGVGGWALAAKQPLWAPQTTFGPHVVRAPDGTFVAVFRVNVLLNASLCPGDGPAPDPGMAGDPAIPYASLVSGDPELGTSIYIAWAPAMAGPWSAVKTNITGMGALHKSNPSIFPMISPAGKWGMAYRYNDHGERNAFAIADDFRGTRPRARSTQPGRCASHAALWHARLQKATAFHALHTSVPGGSSSAQ